MSHTYVHFFYVKTIIDVLYGLDTKKKEMYCPWTTDYCWDKIGSGLGLVLGDRPIVVLW